MDLKVQILKDKKIKIKRSSKTESKQESTNDINLSAIHNFDQSQCFKDFEFQESIVNEGEYFQETESFEVTSAAFKKLLVDSDEEIVNNKRRTSINIQNFILPKNIINIVQQENQYIENIKNFVDKQKNMINQLFKNFMDQILNLVNQKKTKLFQHYDNYLKNYQENYEFFKQKFQEFKNCSSYDKQFDISEFKLESIDIINNQNEEILKSYNAQINTSISEIELEVEKKAVIWMGEELNRQQIQIPMFDEKEQQKIQEKVLDSANIQFERLDGFMKIQKQLSLQNIKGKPKINRKINFDNLSAIGDYNQIKKFKVDSCKVFQTSHNQGILSIAAISNQIIATAGYDYQIKIWDLKANKQLHSFDNNKNFVTSLCKFELTDPIKLMKQYLVNNQPYQKEQILASGNSDYTIALWDLQNYQQFGKLEGHQDIITSIINLNDNYTIASSSKDFTFIIWDVRQRQPKKIIKDHTNIVSCLSLSKDKQMLISGSKDSTFNVYKIIFCDKNQVQNLKLIQIIDNQCSVLCLNTSHLDPNIVITGGSDLKIKIWNLKSGQVTSIIGHKSPICQILLLENPFNKNNDQTIISAGINDQYLKISTSEKGYLNASLMIDKKMNFEHAPNTSQQLQIIQDQENQTVQILCVNNHKIENQFYILNIN